jgi:Fur family transcriptional regulator, zinc uptake regulator
MMTHSSHTHHDFADTALLVAARDALVADGEQWTDMREKVFEILAGSGQPMSAYEVAERLGSAMGRRIAPNSVYRILDLFVGHNIALRVESQNAFLANVHPGCVHDCIFMICDSCGQTTHVDDDKSARTVREAASKDGFAVRRPVLEVRGTCRKCLAA